MDAPGSPIEYAVKMRAFPQEALWRYRIQSKHITTAEIDALAIKISQFHQHAAVAPVDTEWGAPEVLQTTADDNLAVITSMFHAEDEIQQVREIQSWQASQHLTLGQTFKQRKAHGQIKECHGDLHSSNILTLNNRVQVFDCLEFNESLRWIDVISDIAFICMDLTCQQRGDLAARLLNQYLSISGDYEGLAVLRYYQIQRALVRCKVALLRAEQLRAEARDAHAAESEYRMYLDYSLRHIKLESAAIIITHGYSGSGKSTLASKLVERLGAIQLRSDVERKRMHGLTPTTSAAAAPGAGLYADSVTQNTYDRLCLLARHIVDSGLPVIVDAAFLNREHRDLFEKLAQELDVPFHILDIRSSTDAMEARIAARAQVGADASDAGLQVLAHQLAEHDPLAEHEMQRVIVVDSELIQDAEYVGKIYASMT